MALSRSFRETIREQLADKKFRREMLRDAIATMLTGDLDTTKSVMREYINGTLGFVALGEELQKSPKSLLRMLSPNGNPQAKNLLEIVAFLQKYEGAAFRISIATAA